MTTSFNLKSSLKSFLPSNKNKSKTTPSNPIDPRPLVQQEQSRTARTFLPPTPTSTSASTSTTAPNPAKNSIMAQDPLIILCFGDSLTAGYSQWGMKMTPYGTTMKAFLEEQLNDFPDVQVCVQGVSGERVTDGMIRRMEALYSHGNANDANDGDPFTWLVFLGGTNDLGWGKSVDDIWDAIVTVTDIPRLRDGAKVLLCTVPECHAKSARLDGKRNDLNERIKKDERDGVYVFDLHQKLPYHTLEPDERDLVWDDGLHFTEEGYQRIGRMIGQRLLSIIERGQGRIGEKAAESKADATEVAAEKAN